MLLSCCFGHREEEIWSSRLSGTTWEDTGEDKGERDRRKRGKKGKEWEGVLLPPFEVMSPLTSPGVFPLPRYPLCWCLTSQGSQVKGHRLQFVCLGIGGYRFSVFFINIKTVVADYSDLTIVTWFFHLLASALLPALVHICLLWYTVHQCPGNRFYIPSGYVSI